MAKKKANPSQQTFESLEPEPKIREGYYSGDQPNLHLLDFIEQNATPYDAVNDDYNVAAFTSPINTSKSAALYNMHTYWSKKPFDAIQKYIRHYTKPGDIILDPFCGSGSTALAALLEGRKAVAIDRSPAATFITRGYCTPISASRLQRAFADLVSNVRKDMDWLYATKCDRCGGDARTSTVVYSTVFQCTRCLSKVPYYDCVTVSAQKTDGDEKEIKACPHCHSKHRTEEIKQGMASFGRIPVEVNYVCLAGCKPSRGRRVHTDPDSKKRSFFEKYDLGKLNEIENSRLPYPCPDARMLHAPADRERWGLLWRPYLRGIDSVSDFFTKRNFWAVTCLLDKIKASSIAPEHLQFALSSMVLFVTIMHQHNENTGGNISKGTYYVPPVFKDMNVWDAFERKFKSIVKGYSSLGLPSVDLIISTQSATKLAAVPSNSIDYIFTDPPYSWKVQFGEANFLWEVLFGLDSHWHQEEIIVNDVRGVSEIEWADMMRNALRECFRVLKPGRWISLCYHDTSEGTWELLQDLLAECGFVPDVSEGTLFIETAQKTWKQIVSDKVTKRDLVLNFRKPKAGDWRVTQIFLPEDTTSPTFRELASHLIKDFLIAHPGSTKDRIYDTLVSSMVRKGQMEAHNFDSLLKSVADEVQQPVKEDLFRNKDADLFGTHVQSRWYLKETADQVDHAEQAKEDAVASRLGKFIGEYLKKKPELEGVHYSDLFEQYLPVHDKPRRLLADWLLEYFIKTPGGTWRLPEKDEAQQLANLRQAGTLRRIKRFANALIEGVPVRDKDRPGSDVDLLDWLRQCRRAGLYEQGKAIYEKGGLNLANLNDVQQIEAEDDYRICARRGSTEEAKPKRKSRKKQDEDE